MANNFNLITTAGGTVTHKHDGALRFAALPDGVLNGCEFSVSDGVVYITAGTLIIGGRVIDNTASSSFDLLAGTCYLKALISSEDLTLEISASPDVDTEDINLDGSDYSAVLAVFTDGALTKSFPRIAKQGILYGTTSEPADTNYADGTLYIQYQA